MTRSEFNRLFSAVPSNTDGYSAAQLGTINDAVFARHGHLDPNDVGTRDLIQGAFERAYVEIDATVSANDY